MKNRILLLPILLLSTCVFSQQYIDLVKFSYTTTSENTFDEGAATTGLNEMNGDLTLPLVLSENASILTGLIYESIEASFDPGRPREHIRGLALKAGVNIKHSDKLSGTYLLLPKISSDFERIGSDDFQFGGVVLMKYVKSDRFNYQFGAYTNTELFGHFLVPLFGFYYLSPAEKLEIKVLLPLAGNLNYNLSNKTSIGLNFKAQVRSYNLNTAYGEEERRYITRSTNEATAYLQYGLQNGIHIRISVGRSIARKFRVYDETVDFGMPLVYFGDQRTQLNTDFSDSWLFQLGTFYRLALAPDPRNGKM